jgi:hypothetical protein
LPQEDRDPVLYLGVGIASIHVGKGKEIKHYAMKAYGGVDV